MWKDLIGGGVLVTFILVVYTYIYGRISRMEEQMVDKEMCNQKYMQFQERFVRGDERFKEIDRKLDEQLRILTKVDTQLTMFLKGKG